MSAPCAALFAVALFLTVPSGVPQASEIEDLSAELRAIRARHELPALAAATFDRTGLTGLSATGLRSVAGEVEVSASDRWHLGSCTKAMTATLAARLVERDLLGWQTTIGEVFGEQLADMHPDWAQVPLRLLLSNRAGAPGKLVGTPLWMQLVTHTGSPREQRQALLEGVLSQAPESPPGSKFVYSNAGFCIAGAMLEKLADASWEELMQREVFEPLGMASAGFGPPGTKDELDEPLGHRIGKSGAFPMGVGRFSDNPIALAPSGRVHASLGDWALFAGAHLTRDASFLSEESWRVLQAPLDGQHYGFGWGFYPRDWAAGVAMHHSGSNTMWYCTVWMAPERGFGLLVATNVGGEAAAKACDEVALALSGRLVPAPAGER